MLGNVARTDCTSFRRVAVLSYREGTVVASQQSRPRRSLVLEMEIPDGGPRGSVQPRKIRMASLDCLSAYSLAWAALAFVMHQDQALDRCIANLLKVVSSKSSTSNVENLSLAAIAINAAERNANPFHVVI